MQDAMIQLVANSVASSSSKSLSLGGKKGQSTVMTMPFICEQIDMELNDTMLALSKQLSNVVKPVVHNEIQVAQQPTNMKDNSTLVVPWENVASGNALANQLGGNLPSHQIGNTGR